MAIYVTSDAHGHLHALDSALEQAAPSAGDTVYVLGDMIDRGPDPVGVLELVHSLPGARVLMGNHERMMLDVIAKGSPRDELIWEQNGGFATASGLDALPRERYLELMDWIAGLPLFDAVEAGGRSYLLAHAGINPLRLIHTLSELGVDASGSFADVPVETLRTAMAKQLEYDLLWIREGFWGCPTGLVGPDGRGPVVVAGHTPSLVLGRYAVDMCGTGGDESGRGVMVEVGPTFDTGGVADRIDIDCSAAAGASCGRVGVMRLDDRRIWYADVKEGE